MQGISRAPSRSFPVALLRWLSGFAVLQALKRFLFTLLALRRELEIELRDAQGQPVADAEVAMCWRVAPGPDFVLVVHVHDMPAYLALVQRLFTQDANVRNVKAFFSVKRSKMVPALSLGLADHLAGSKSSHHASDLAPTHFLE